MKFVRFTESMLINSIKKKKRMFLQLALRARAGKGRRQEDEPVPLIKCTEFRLNYFRGCFRRIRRCITGVTSPLLVFSVRDSRTHGTWQYLEVFRILHEAWICLECCIFFVCSFSSEYGRGNDDRGSMYRVSLMRLWEHTSLIFSLTLKKN